MVNYPCDAFFRRRTYRGSNGCWDWTGYVQSSGYGQFSVKGKRKLAHREAWRVYRGDIPKSSMILHICDNRRCCNPEHLFIGDARANNDDARTKGRARTPPRDAVTKPRHRKLSHEDVRRILLGGEDGHVLAKALGVREQTIRQIRNGKRKVKLGREILDASR